MFAVGDSSSVALFFGQNVFFAHLSWQSYITLTFLTSKSISKSINDVSCLSFGEVQCKNHQFMHFRAFIFSPHEKRGACTLFPQCYASFYRFVIVICLNTEHLVYVSDRIGISKSWFLWRGKSGVPGEKPLGARETTNNKHNPHMALTPGFEPGPHWWEASAFTTLPPLLPQ